MFLAIPCDSMSEPPAPNHHVTPSLLRILHVRHMKPSHSTSQLICIEPKTPNTPTPAVRKFVRAKSVQHRYVIDSEKFELPIDWLVLRSNACCEPTATLWVQCTYYFRPFKPILSADNARGKVFPIFLPTPCDSVAEPPSSKPHVTPSMLRILLVQHMKFSHSTSQLICIEIKTPTTPNPRYEEIFWCKICPQQVRDRLRNGPTSHRLAGVTLKCTLWASWNLVITMSSLFLSI